MNIDEWRHHHSFGEDKEHIEKKTLIVVIITILTMFAEITVGLITNSMALFADGVHMGTHAFALGISLLAYVLARKNTGNNRFVFGTWKIEILGAYTSALILGVVALSMVYASIERIINPVSIHYNQALLVAIIGLAVNLTCAIILNGGGGNHGHHHEHGTDHSHDHDDLNLKSAYMHVVADAITSVFAITALLGAKYYQLDFLDPFMGIVGAILITRWAFNLLRDSSIILLDYNHDDSLAAEIKGLVEVDGRTAITDLHLWKVADNSYSCIIALVSSENLAAADIKHRLGSISKITHVTIEINVIEQMACS